MRQTLRTWREMDRHSRVGIVAVVVVVFAMVLAATVLVDTLVTNSNKVDNQERGRAFAVPTGCELHRAVIDAGVKAIKSGVLLPGDSLVDGNFRAGPLTRQLGPNFPSYPERVIAANAAADSYEDSIAKAIIKAAPNSPPPLTNNHLDCDKLTKLSLGQ